MSRRDDPVTVQVTVYATHSDKSVMVSIPPDGRDKAQFIPLSLILESEPVDRQAKKASIGAMLSTWRITIPEWLAYQKGLI